MWIPKFIYFERDPPKHSFSILRLIVGVTAAILVTVLILLITQLYFAVFPRTPFYIALLFTTQVLFSILVAIIVGVFFSPKSFAVQNKMSKLIQQKKYQEVINLGESVPKDKLLFYSRVNLAAAYYYTGRVKEARDLINNIKLPSFIFPPSKSALLKKAIEDWKEKINN